MSHDDLPEEQDVSDFPIGEIFADAYRHIWRYRWPYLGQLAVWTAMMWLSRFPTRFISGVTEQSGLVLPVLGYNITPWIVADIIELIFYLLGGGLIFLSCGCAILFGRRPRAGDVLRLPAVKGFWLPNVFFWIVADLIAVFALHGHFLAMAIANTAHPWLNPIAWWVGYRVYPVLIWALLALALAIAAFESSAVAFHDAWQRLRNHRQDVLALFVIVAAPVVALQLMLDYAPSPMLFMFSIPDMLQGVAYPVYVTGLTWAGIFLSFLLILVLSASTLLVYRHLAPDSDEVARAFD
jgi:hypothetical protein